MKMLLKIIILIISSIYIMSQDTLYNENIKLDTCLLESYVNNGCNEFKNYFIQSSWEIKMLQSSGYCFFHDFNKKEYENKSIGYIVENFSKKYKYLDAITFNGFEKIKPNDKFRRNSFYFYFKINDSTLLSMHGGIDFRYEEIIRNDKKAKQHILKQNHFIMNFTQINIAKYVNVTTNDLIDEFERVNNTQWKIVKKHFHYLFPKDKKN